jgi:flagella basal body P-ring formation protein FlgA
MAATSTYTAHPAQYDNAKIARTIDAANQPLAADATEMSLAHCITVSATGGPFTITAAPTLPDGYDGQLVQVINVGASNVVLQDQGTLASSNLRLFATTVTLAPRQSIFLRYLSAIGDWVQATALTTVI